MRVAGGRPLLRSQRDRRIEPRRPPGRPPAGERRHAEQQRDHAEVRHRIERRDARRAARRASGSPPTPAPARARPRPPRAPSPGAPPAPGCRRDEAPSAERTPISRVRSVDAARRARRRSRPPRAPAPRARTPRTGPARSAARPPRRRPARPSSRPARSAGPCPPTRSPPGRRGRAPRRRPAPRTTSDIAPSAKCHCVGVHVHGARGRRAASDTCLTSPTTPTTVYQSPSASPIRSRWPIGSPRRETRPARTTR